MRKYTGCLGVDSEQTYFINVVFKKYPACAMRSNCNAVAWEFRSSPVLKLITGNN